MKKIIMMLVIGLVVTLSACGSKLDYKDLDKKHVKSFLSAESKNEDTYFVYYYSSDSVYSDNVKEDMLKFIDGFTETSFYMLDVSKASDESTFYEYESVPTVFVIDEGAVYEKFESESGVKDFIFKYATFNLLTFDDELDYPDFDHLDNYTDILDRPEDKYVVYFYSVSCGYCVQIKDYILDFALENDTNMKIYFMDAYNIKGVYPFEEQYGTPSIFVVEDGEIIYTTSGANSVPAYLNALE